MPSRPSNKGIISLRFAGARSIGWPQTIRPNFTIGKPIQFQAQAEPHTHPTNGRHPDTKTEGLAASTLLISNCPWTRATAAASCCFSASDLSGQILLITVLARSLSPRTSMLRYSPTNRVRSAYWCSRNNRSSNGHYCAIPRAFINRAKAVCQCCAVHLLGTYNARITPLVCHTTSSSRSHECTYNGRLHSPSWCLGILRRC